MAQQFAYGTATAATATATSATPTTNQAVNVTSVNWSYNGTPASAGTLQLTDNTLTWSIDITVGGPGFMPLDLPFTPGAVVTGTLTTGGSGVQGKLTIVYWVG